MPADRPPPAAAPAGLDLRDVLESLTEGFAVLDRDWRFTYFNAAAERLNGVRREDVLGRSHWELYPDAVGTELEGHYRRAMADRVPARFLNHYAPWDRWFEVGLTPTADGGLAVTWRDVTEANRAEADRRADEGRLRDSEALFRELADAAPAITWTTDPAGRCTYLSRRWHETTGQAAAEGLGLGWTEATHPGDKDRVAGAFLAANAARKPFTADYRLRQADGSYRWALDVGRPRFAADGTYLGMVGNVFDVHDRRAAEEQYRALFDAIDQGFCLIEMVPAAGGRPADYRFLEANPTFERQTGLTAALGRTARELVPDLEGHWFETYGRVAATGEPARFEERSAAMGRWFEVEATRVGGPGSRRVAVLFRDVTDRKRAADALRASEERFRVAADAVNGIIYDFDPRTGRVERSRGLAEVVGYSPDEVPPTVGWWQDQTHPDDRGRLAALAAAERSAGAARLVATYRVRHRDGRWLHVEDRAVLVRDAAGRVVRMVGCTVDVTDRVRAEEAARESLARLDFVLRSAGVGLWLNPLPLGKMHWDERVKAHFHLPPGSDPVIDDFWARLHPDDRGPTRRAIDDALAGRADFDVDYRTVDPATGAVRWVRAIGTPTFAPDGTPARFDGVTLDVTARKQAEDRLREEDRRKDEFLALLAHELRNPLAPLRNGLQILRLAPPGSDAAAGAREVMGRQLDHMVRLVDDLLDVSRITQGKMILRRARVALAEVVAAAVEGAGPAVEAAGHTLTVSLPPEPVALDADLTRLAQVFSNLLTNSTKYTPAGGHLWLTAARDGAEAVVSVRDSGLGIPAEFLPRLFDMFSQVDRSVEKATGGLGIGLALVKGLVEMHGGAVSAESPGPGRGSTFTVRLPTIAEGGVRNAESEPADPAATPAFHPAPRNPNSAIKRRVLVVDDNRDSAESMAEMLRLLGNEVETAHDGLEAVAAGGRARPDLILMDVGMPKLNGLDATRRIRQEPWGGGVAIVALTGWGQDDDRARSRAAGCDGHLVKPVSLADLEAAVAGVGAAGRNGTG